MFKGWKRQLAARTARAARRFLRESDGITASEYAFMLGLMIVFLIGAISVLSDTSKAIHEEITTTLNTSVANNL